MSISGSKIVDIQPRVIASSANDLETNGLVLTKSALIPADSMYVTFQSLTSVGSYFGTQSTEYALAEVYFTSYINKFKAPSALSFGRVVQESAGAWLRSAPLPKLEVLKTIEGEIKVTVGGEVKTADIDLTEKETQSAMAEAIATAIGGVTGEYNAVLNEFVFTTTQKGKAVEISVAEDGETATALCLTADAGAVTSVGADAMTLGETMSYIVERFKNFVTFVASWAGLSDDEQMELADWASKNYGYAYFGWSEKQNCKIATSDADIASKIKKAQKQYVMMVYGDARYAMFFSGIFASTPWNRYNGVMTGAFKRSGALSTNVDNDTDFEALNSKGYNVLGNFACRNTEFNVTYAGQMLYGDFNYADALISNIWLNSKIQTSIFLGLQSASRVPYNSRGYGMVYAWIADAVNAGLYNGCVDTGIPLSESQSNQVMNEVGEDISDELESAGFKIIIKPADAQTRYHRESPEVSVYYTYGGSIQKVNVASTVLL